MQRAIYSTLLRLALPLQVLRQFVRGFGHAANRSSLRSHLAIGLAPRVDRPLWLHAASVGEVQSLVPLVQRLRSDFPSMPLLVSVGTATGLARARQQFGVLLDASAAASPALTLVPAPWDLPGATRRFIAAQRPGMGVFVETELWPNLLHAASRAGVVLLLASGRVSERSAARYGRWAAALMRDTVRTFTRIGTQTPDDRDRFISLGADPDAVGCWGNLKFDFTPPAEVAARALALRARLAAQRQMWVAGSTHPGEEEACLAAHASLQEAARARGAQLPLLVIAPRRPERFDVVARLITARNFRLQRHSDPATGRAGDAADVQLVDSMGELLPYYAAADVVFVGGSLAPVGGHNLLEPAVFGKPVLAGPHTGNSPEIATRLEAAGGLTRVADACSLAGVLQELLWDTGSAGRSGQAAAAVVAAHGGATTRTLAAISAELARRAGPGAFPPAPSASC